MVRSARVILCLMFLAIGCSKHETGWDFTIQNHSGQSFKDVVVVYDGHQFGIGACSSGANATVAGALPKAVDVVMTDENGAVTKVRADIPESAVDRTRPFPSTYIIIESPTKVTVSKIDPERKMLGQRP